MRGGGQDAVCDLLKNAFPGSAVAYIRHLIIGIVIGEAGDGCREVIKCNAVSTTCTSAISHDINAGVCFILVEIIIKIIGVRIGGELLLRIQAETGQVGGIGTAWVHTDGDKAGAGTIMIFHLPFHIGGGHHHSEGLGVAGFITARTISKYIFFDIITGVRRGSGDPGVAVLRFTLGEQNDLWDTADRMTVDLNARFSPGKLLCAEVNARLCVLVHTGACPVSNIKSILNRIIAAIYAISGDCSACQCSSRRIGKIGSVLTILIMIQGKEYLGGLRISYDGDSVIWIRIHQSPDSGLGGGKHGIDLVIACPHFRRHIQNKHSINGHAGLIHDGGSRAQGGQADQEVGIRILGNYYIISDVAGEGDIGCGHSFIRPDASDVLGGEVLISSHPEDILPAGQGAGVRRGGSRVRRQGRAGQQAEQHTDRQQPAQRLSQFSHVAFLLFSSRTECSQPAQGGRCVQAPLTS